MSVLFSSVEKAVANIVSDRTVVRLDFSYAFPDKNHTFNMNRDSNEQLSVLVSRIKNNFLKLSKQKKGGNKKNKVVENLDVDVRFIASQNLKIEDLKKENFDQSLLLDVEATELTVADVFIKYPQKYYLLLNKVLYYFDVDPPTVASASLSSCIKAGYHLHAIDLKLVNASIEDTNFFWFASQDKFEDYSQAKDKLDQLLWVKIGEGVTLKPTPDCCGKILKVSEFV